MSQAGQGKKPVMRQCVGCRRAFPKRSLIRVVRSPEGVIGVDRTGKSQGRGAYLCGDPECLKKAIKTKALSRALEASVPEEVYESLRSQLEARS